MPLMTCCFRRDPKEVKEQSVRAVQGKNIPGREQEMQRPRGKRTVAITTKLGISGRLAKED